MWVGFRKIIRDGVELGVGDSKLLIFLGLKVWEERVVVLIQRGLCGKGYLIGVEFFNEGFSGLG